jgi:uncharacterized integral membrane protein (TIGR00697 family)
MDRKEKMLIICCLIFMGSLILADISSVKLIEASIFGLDVLVPLGTVAFALTFLATDVISEVYGKKQAVYILVTGLTMRGFIAFYFYICAGDTSGNVIGLRPPEFWTQESQNSYAFMLDSSMPIFIGGFIAVLIASLNDVYVFHWLKRKHENKNKFWVRNNISTIFSQFINSFLFITIAYAASMPVKGIVMAIVGQVIVKFGLAIFDTPLAYLMRNYANGNSNWYKFWEGNFWKG